MPNDEFIYLGDGVYVRYDGYYIELRTNDPGNPTDKIFLDPPVWAVLMDFVERRDKELRNLPKRDT